MVSIRQDPYEPKMYRQIMLNGYNSNRFKKKAIDKNLIKTSFFDEVQDFLPQIHAFNLVSVPTIMSCTPWNISNLFPPFPLFWVEGFQLYGSNDNSSKNYGIMVKSEFNSELDNDCYAFFCVPFVKFKDSIYGPYGVVLFHANKDGNALEDTDKRIITNGANFITDDSAPINSFVCKAVMNFLGLINAKNVSCPERKFDVNRYNKRKLDAQKANRYHILKIHKPGEKIRKDPATGENEGKMPLHVVRGHLRTYSEEGNGLFGREQYGTFFIRSHVRGKEENGKVTKDYVLV